MIQVGTTTLLSHFLDLSETDNKTKQDWRKSSSQLHFHVPKIFSIKMANRNIMYDMEAATLNKKISLDNL